MSKTVPAFMELTHNPEEAAVEWWFGVRTPKLEERDTLGSPTYQLYDLHFLIYKWR